MRPTTTPGANKKNSALPTAAVDLRIISPHLPLTSIPEWAAFDPPEFAAGAAARHGVCCRPISNTGGPTGARRSARIARGDVFWAGSDESGGPAPGPTPRGGTGR